MKNEADIKQPQSDSNHGGVLIPESPITSDILDGAQDPATQDALDPEPAQLLKVPRWRRAMSWYWGNRKWTLVASLLLVIIILAAVPWSRYHAAGLVLKQNYTIKIVDATTGTPVSGATVYSGNLSVQTTATGQANLRLPVGAHSFSFNKKYYRMVQAEFTVPIFHQKAIPDIRFIATGRQVKLTITNLINKKPLANVDIAVAGINAKTDKSGAATIVLPIGQTSYQTTLALAGYNDAKVAVNLSNTAIQNNPLNMTPSGKIYYLSNQTGVLSVMKANLDGTSPEVVLAGTGSESLNQTQIARSPDQKYLALLTQRSSAAAGPQLYVISATDDRLLSVDSSDADFHISGWSYDSLVYTSTRRDLPSWQPGLSKIKAYNAPTGKMITLDQSIGSDAATGTNEIYSNVMLSGANIVFSKYWTGDPSSLAGKQDSVQVIGSDGQNHKVVASYDSSLTTHSIYQHSLTGFYIRLDYYSGSPPTTFYDYIIGAAPKQLGSGATITYNYPSYYLSPSGNQIFWSDQRDGKSSLLVADSSGGAPTTIKSLDDYIAAGWYTDQYVLLTKSDSELYIMSATGGSPIKVANYQATNIY